MNDHQAKSARLQIRRAGAVRRISSVEVGVALVGLGVLLLGLAQWRIALAGGVVTNCNDDTQFSTMLAGGGTITFNCGGAGAVATITVASTKMIANTAIINGGGKITLSGGNVRRIFQVNASGALTLQNMTLSNGQDFGGGAIVNDGTLTIDNSRLSNNTLTGQFGGAIKNTGAVTITNSLLTNNSAPTGYGGAIDSAEATSLVVVVNSVFSNNSAHLGGGAIANNGVVRVTESTFTGNSTASSGGTSGGGAIETTGSLTIASSTFAGNTAGKGGAVYNEGGVATITNSTFSGNAVNTAPRTGGAIHNQNNGVVTVIAGTLVDNTAMSGAGGNLYNESGTVNIRQSIVSGGSPGNCGGAISTQGNNLESGTDCNFTAGGDLHGVDPQIGTLADNGGLTFTHALLGASLAIDAVISGCTDSSGGALAMDQRGVARPQDGNGDSLARCDIGAFEYQSGTVTPSPPTPTPTPTATPLAGVQHVYLPFIRR